MHYDFDHVPDLARLKQRLIGSSASVFVFLSPGGDGVKFGLAVEGITDDVSYKRLWHSGLRWKTAFLISISLKTSNVTPSTPSAS